MKFFHVIKDDLTSWSLMRTLNNSNTKILAPDFMSVKRSFVTDRETLFENLKKR